MSLFKSKFINPFLRFGYRLWDAVDGGIRKGILNRIRYSGSSDLKVDDLSFKMYSKCDDGIVDALYFKNKEYAEITEVKLFKEFAKRSSTVLDIGANTGLYSIISRKVNRDSKIYAFEPYLINANRLRKNLALNEINDVQILELALGDSEGEIEFAVPDQDQICDVLSADIEFSNKFYRKWVDYKNVKVPQKTLDQVVREEKIEKVDLIKIDVENYETFVIKGALDTLDKFSPLILIEIFVDEEKVKFFEEHLKPLGYHCYLILKEGLIRTETLSQNPDCRNFILTKLRSEQEYLSYKETESIMQLMSY